MSLQCPFDLSQRYFIKIPRLQCPNQGSHMMEFILLSLKSVCMIAIRALTGIFLENWCGGVEQLVCLHNSKENRQILHSDQ